ncbi:MAG: tetratricopeptide repeat protein [Deltaproteobacteria bacterium]|nr:tetratricopeptide repeat protein [Deltaproteobacteria bacterium]
MEAPHDIRRLQAQVAARPGDPLGHAELAAALFASGQAQAAGDARARARDLITGCMHLGLHDVALQAATRLHEAFARVEDTVLLAEISAARKTPEDLARARRLVEAVVEADPGAVPARLRAAAFALGAGEPSEARRWIEPVAHLDAKTRALYIQTLMVEGWVAAAFEEARVAVLAHPGAAELWELLGANCLELGRPDAAIDAYSEVLRIAPERAHIYYNLALAFARTGSVAAALGVVDAGLEARPGDERLATLRAALVDALGFNPA